MTIRAMDRIPPINDWDKAIMETYPYRYADLWSNISNFSMLDEMVNWSKLNIGQEEFTWKNITFFFKHKDDMILFMMRWA